MRRTTALMILALGQGCSGKSALDDSGLGGSGTDLSHASAGESSGDILVEAYVLTDTSNGVPEDAEVRFSVTVTSPTGEALEDVEVIVRSAADEITLYPSDDPTEFEANTVGYEQAYALDVSAGDRYLRDIVLVGPTLHSAALDPSPPVVEQEATLTWSPSNEDDVDASIYVWLDGKGFTSLLDTDTRDDGKEVLSGTTFPAPGAYTISVNRDNLLWLNGPDSYGAVIVEASIEVEIP